MTTNKKSRTGIFFVKADDTEELTEKVNEFFKELGECVIRNIQDKTIYTNGSYETIHIFVFEEFGENF